MTKQQIVAIAKEQNIHLDDYNYVGVRVQDGLYGMAEGQGVTYCSKVWVDGNETEDEIDGICAVDVSKWQRLERSDLRSYFGNVAVVLGSQWAKVGEDEAEIIMQDAVIIAIINL